MFVLELITLEVTVAVRAYEEKDVVCMASISYLQMSMSHNPRYVLLSIFVTSYKMGDESALVSALLYLLL